MVTFTFCLQFVALSLAISSTSAQFEQSTKTSLEDPIVCPVGNLRDKNVYGHAGSWLYIFPELKSSCKGYITKWNYFNLNNGSEVYFSVWRRLTGSAVQYGTFRLLGSNKVSAGAGGWETYEVPKEDQIYVTEDSMLAFHYRSAKLPSQLLTIPWGSKFTGVSKKDLLDVIAIPTNEEAILTEDISNGFNDLTVHAVNKNLRLPAFSADVVPMELGATESTTTSTTTTTTTTTTTPAPTTPTTTPTSTTSSTKPTTRTTITTVAPIPALCLIEKDMGSCNTWSQVWSYSPGVKKCQGYWWAGCTFNRNHFKTEEECTSFCPSGTF